MIKAVPMLCFDKMTVEEFIILLQGKVSSLTRNKWMSPEVAYIDRLILHAANARTALSFFDKDKQLHNVYENRYLESLIETMDLFIENPTLSVHAVKQEIQGLIDPLDLKPYLDVYNARESR